MMAKRLNGKAALVTGGGSGIGRGAALAFARHGASVCIVERDKARAEETRHAVEREGAACFVALADVADPTGVEAAFEQANRQFGRLDIVFANAGINGVLAPIEEMEPEEWSRTIDINLKGTFLTVKYAVPLLKQQGGSIIVTSSVNGNRIFSNFGFSAYSTSKAGQVAFMKMAALELARYRIRVNAICPGAIRTHIDESTHPTPEVEEIRIPVQFPDGGDIPLTHKPGSPEQVAELALFLAGDESSHITGTEIYIDGAESLIRG
ncbi:MAG: SDR family oxidoreductase [Paenibacillaceae bacterium]|nr:SDR family oxidoreductase [Paenibacillaceae bacterium]